MSDRQVIRIFISSPSDVRPERLIAEQMVQRLDREFQYYCRVEPVLWEKKPLKATQHFQHPDNIPAPRTTDLVVVILWSRLGVTLPTPDFVGAKSGRPVTGTEWEFEDAWRASEEHGTPDLMVYRKTAPVLTLSIDEAEERSRQKRLVDDFINRWFINAEDGTFRAASHTFADPVAFEETLYQHLRVWLLERLGNPDDLHTVRWHQGSPFRGLESFGIEHAQVFFGRRRAKNELREALARQFADHRPLLLVVGASGSGKSSLVKAGLLPDLLRPGMLAGVGLVRWAVMRPGDGAGQPMAALAAALRSPTALPELSPDSDTLGNLPPTALAETVADALATAARTAELAEPWQPRLVLVVDQLEELFAGTVSAEHRTVFLAALEELVLKGNTIVVATLRSDFFPVLEAMPNLAALTTGAGRVLLMPPNDGEIGEIIVGPAQEAGLLFEPHPESGLPLNETLRQDAAAEPGVLPLLEFTLEQLWHRRQGNQLTHAVYQELGGLKGAVGRRAEEIYSAQSEKTKSQLAAVLRTLVAITATGQATARSAALSSFSPEGRQLVEALLHPQARLLLAEGDGEGARVRVAHEALLSHWPRATRQIAQDFQDLQLRGRLEEAAARWRAAEKKDRESLLLPSGLPLREGRGLLKRWTDGELEPEMVAYVKSSIAHQGRKRMKLSSAALTLLVVASAIIVCRKEIESLFGVWKVQQEMAFVTIPGGCFQMGSPETEVKRSVHEGPVHEVCVDAFELGKFEVAQGEWEAVMLANSSEFKAEGSRNPVETVTWHEAQEFIGKMNSWGKNGYRLPTEAEWEYACRSAGKIEKYAGGGDVDQVAWYKDNSAEKTHPVGQRVPNGLGLYDMSGNVFEWVQDTYDVVAYRKHSRKNPLIYFDSSIRRVFRGGSYSTDPSGERCAYRGDEKSDERGSNLGLRLARKIGDKEGEERLAKAVDDQKAKEEAERLRKEEVARKKFSAHVSPELKAGLEFVKVPGGTFIMGCGSWQEQEWCKTDEEPPHAVTVDTFEIGKYEVTQGQWKAMMGSNPSGFSSCGDDCPVEQVSWDDVQSFITKLNAQGDDKYRLPTEAEWEYACRSGGKPEKYCGGDSVDEIAWNTGNSGNKPHPVGRKDPNGLGIYDMSGNVWEWVEDWYSAKFYETDEAKELNPLSNDNASDGRVFRGGSWSFGPVSSSDRMNYPPYNHGIDIGFRLARVPWSPPAPSGSGVSEVKLEAMDREMVVAKAGKLREGPTGKGKIVGDLKEGEKVRVLGRTVDGKWYRGEVKVEKEQKEGYVIAEVLVEESALEEAKKKREEERLVRAEADRKAKAVQKAEAASSASGGSAGAGAHGIAFVSVPGGTFEMGCGSWQSDCSYVEKPVHMVTVGSFEIGQYEVTQSQWRAVMGSNPSFFSSCGDNCPAESVSWEDVQDFIKKLNAQGGGNYRLPTEAEWEYACRSGGKPEKYCGGDNEDSVGWHKENSGKMTHPVGQKAPNGLGIYDMSGNVREWVADWYQRDFYGSEGAKVQNPVNNNNASNRRIQRGGSWDIPRDEMRSTSRDGYAKLDFRGINNGVRVVRVP